MAASRSSSSRQCLLRTAAPSRPSTASPPLTSPVLKGCTSGGRDARARCIKLDHLGICEPPPQRPGQFLHLCRGSDAGGEAPVKVLMAAYRSFSVPIPP
jgi:hypothetical protein